MTEDQLARHQALSNAARLPRREPLAPQREAKRAIRRFRAAYHRTHELLRAVCDQAQPIDLDELSANVQLAHATLHEAQSLPLTRLGLRARVTAMDNRDVAEEALGVAQRRSPLLPAHLRERPAEASNLMYVQELRGAALRLNGDWEGKAKVIVQVSGQPYSIVVPPKLALRLREAAAVQAAQVNNPYPPKLVLVVVVRSRRLQALYFE